MASSNTTCAFNLQVFYDLQFSLALQNIYKSYCCHLTKCNYLKVTRLFVDHFRSQTISSFFFFYWLNSTAFKPTGHDDFTFNTVYIIFKINQIHHVFTSLILCHNGPTCSPQHGHVRRILLRLCKHSASCLNGGGHGRKSDTTKSLPTCCRIFKHLPGDQGEGALQLLNEGALLSVGGEHLADLVHQLHRPGHVEAVLLAHLRNQKRETVM